MPADTIVGLIVAMRGYAARRHSTGGSRASGQRALLARFVFPLWRVITPFAGIRIVAGVVVLTLFGARVIGAAEFRAPVAYDGRRIRLTKRRRSSRR